MSNVSDVEVSLKLIDLRRSAKSRNIVFNLSFNRVRQLMNAKKCFYTGIAFDETVDDLKRSCDRVFSDKGYTDDNVVPCLKRFNNIKANSEYKELILMINGIEKHCKKAGINPKTLLKKKLRYEKEKPPAKSPLVEALTQP